jgi:hypothetical protein
VQNSDFVENFSLATAKETAGRKGKSKDGRARTREVKLAVFFTQDDVDDDGYPVRDRDSASYIATFEPAASFGDLVKAEGIRRGAAHVRQLTILGDGAAWIWNIAASTFSEATQIVDLFHAREHLHSPARSRNSYCWTAGTSGSPPAWRIPTTATSTASRPQSADTLSRGRRKTRSRRNSATSLNNAPRMRYRWSRSRSLFVGSGVVESGCKAIIGQRLKPSGMRWTIPGADAIATLRCQQASRPEDRIWPAHHNQIIPA